MESRECEYDWARTLVALPHQVLQITERGNLIYENQCLVFRSLVYSVAQYAQQWIGPFQEEIRTAAAVGEELIRVLRKGMELITSCTDETSPGLIFIIFGSLGRFREIIDDVRRYSQMVNQLISNLIQYEVSKADSVSRVGYSELIDQMKYKLELVDQMKSKVEIDCKALDTTLEWAFKRDKLAFRASDSLMLKHLRLEEGALETIDKNDLSLPSKLGKGSFGKVKKFLWCGTIPVAVKEFGHTSYYEDELHVYRRMTSDDYSTHVVQILGHYLTEEIEGNQTINKGHIVLELMETNLERVIGEKEVTILQSVDILLQIAKAMKCVHAKNVIYRDLKPANILVNRNEDKSFHIKLADFGISKTNFDTIHEQHTAYRGTGLYMAPEVMVAGIDGNTNYSRTVDVYSFGVVCSQILTNTLTRTLLQNIVGKPPMKMESVMDKLKEESLKKWIPKRLKSLIVGCWEKDGNKRPSFQHICEELWYIKEELLFGKAEDDHIQNAIKQLGIDKDNYYNFAVCGANEFIKSIVIDWYLDLKGSEAAVLDQTPKIKCYTNPKLRPHVALWKVPDYSTENFSVDKLLSAFDCILILPGSRNAMFLEADKQLANEARNRNMKVAAINVRYFKSKSKDGTTEVTRSARSDLRESTILRPDIPLFILCFESISRLYGGIDYIDDTAGITNFIVNCVKSRF